VKIAGTTALAGSVQPGSAWIRGNSYNAGASTPTSLKGSTVAVSRPDVLVNSTGHYYTVVQPTYADYDISNIINIKSVAAYPVAGDGSTDDTTSIQAILNNCAGKQVVYFPYGIYILTDTLTIPVGSRLVGEAFTQFAASGTKFKDANNPKAMIRVGNVGDVGVAQMQDFMFTVADILPGTILVEVNMAGTNPGDVGFWFCNFRIAGAKGSKVETACTNAETCVAARLSAHFTASSSSYWEHTWAWSADLDVDGSNSELASPGGGFLIESTKGTWMLGMGSGKFNLLIATISS
jgi:glucan 1,3-beta-glucosidase